MCETLLLLWGVRALPHLVLKSSILSASFDCAPLRRLKRACKPDRQTSVCFQCSAIFFPLRFDRILDDVDAHVRSESKAKLVPPRKCPPPLPPSNFYKTCAMYGVIHSSLTNHPRTVRVGQRHTIRYACPRSRCEPSTCGPALGSISLALLQLALDTFSPSSPNRPMILSCRD